MEYPKKSPPPYAKVLPVLKRRTTSLYDKFAIWEWVRELEDKDRVAYHDFYFDLYKFSQALRALPHLYILNLANSNVDSYGATKLADSLRMQLPLRVLILRFNEIGSAGAIALADALKVNTCLQKLNLCGNEIGSNGAKALASVLTVNSSLRELNVSSNKLGGEEVDAFATALQSGQFSLQKLNLSKNPVSHARHFGSLARALKQNSSLQELVLWGCKIDFTVALAFGEALKVNSSLQVLNLYRNPIGCAGAEALAKSLKVDCTLKELNVVDFADRTTAWPLSPKWTFYEMLKVNISLEKLSMHPISCTRDGLEKSLRTRLRRNIAFNRKLRQMKVSNEKKQLIHKEIQENNLQSLLDDKSVDVLIPYISSKMPCK